MGKGDGLFADESNLRLSSLLAEVVERLQQDIEQSNANKTILVSPNSSISPAISRVDPNLSEFSNLDMKFTSAEPSNTQLKLQCEVRVQAGYSLSDFQKNIDSLFHYCSAGDIDKVKAILDHIGPRELEIALSTVHYGAAPMHIACSNGYLNLVKYLYEKGASLDIPTGTLIKPLHLACQNSHRDVIQFLLSKKVKVNACDDNGVTALHISVLNQDIKTTQILLTSSEMDINCKGPKGFTPLHIAAHKGDMALTLLLLAHGADANIVNDNKDMPSNVAHKNHHESVANILEQFLISQEGVKLAHTLNYVDFSSKVDEVVGKEVDVILKDPYVPPIGEDSMLS